MSYLKTKAQSGNQTLVLIANSLLVTSSSSSASFTLVGEVSDFTQQGVQNKSDDATNLQSTAEEFIPTILTPGKMSGVMNRVSNDAGQVLVKASFNGVPPTVVLYNVRMPIAAWQSTTGDQLFFYAMVEEFNNIGNIKPDKTIKTQYSLKISGPIVEALGT
jgi:hypothetical protein